MLKTAVQPVSWHAFPHFCAIASDRGFLLPEGGVVGATSVILAFEISCGRGRRYGVVLLPTRVWQQRVGGIGGPHAVGICSLFASLLCLLPCFVLFGRLCSPPPGRLIGSPGGGPWRTPM